MCGRNRSAPTTSPARDLRLTFKVDGLAHVGTFEVFLSSDNLATNNVHYPVSIPVQPYIADGEWAAVTISWGDLANNFPPGSITRSKVNFVEFRFEDDGVAPVTFHLNEVAAVPQPAPQRRRQRRLRRRLGIHLHAGAARARPGTATAPPR